VLKKSYQKINLSKIFAYCFYGFFLLIISTCFLETITHPGLFLNKTGISLSDLTARLGLICLLSYFQLCFSKSSLKYQKTLIIFSLVIIFVTLILNLIESSNYPNFVFSKFHLNYFALNTLSYFLFTFFILSIFSNLISKININPVLNKKIIISLLLFLTPILSYVSWNQHLYKNNIIIPEPKIFSFTEKKFTFLEDESKKQPFKDQITWFFKPTNQYSIYKIFFNLITVSLGTIFCFTAILFYINWLQNKKSIKIGITLLIFYLGGIAYSALIILISVTMFSVGELKAFQGRYILTYILAMIMFSLYLFLIKLNKQKKINLLSIIYLSILFFLINIPNLINLKPADKKIFLNRKKDEIFYQKIEEGLKNSNKPIFLHVITTENAGPISYRYFLVPVQIISPIWQDWDTFMFKNPAFKTATHVFLLSKTTITNKWSDLQIDKIFKDKKFVVNNGLYRVVYKTDDKSSFQLELINQF